MSDKTPGRKPDTEIEFARGTKILDPQAKAVLKGMWLSGRFGSKQDLAEAAGLQYDTVRHLASFEGWPTEHELRKEIHDAAAAAVRKLRDTSIADVLEQGMARHARLGKILDNAMDQFEKDGALVAVDMKTGEKTFSKGRMSDLKALIETHKIYTKTVSEITGLDEVHKQTSGSGKGGNNTLITNSAVRMNFLVKGKNNE